jgi:tetratricopeptide (TPR) repeat protein
MLQLVGAWLRGSGKQWLLVLDNADIEAVIFKPVDVINATSPGTAQKRIIDFLAIPSRGQTVLTTRHNKVASQFVDDCDIITVGPMTKSDSINLFRKKAGEHHDAMDVEELVGELGYIPLAIAHAAAFIKRKVPLCTVQIYLQELRKTAVSDASLLTANYNELRRDGEANNSVIDTWQVSFEHIRHIRPSAADCLSLMSFYDHRSISRTLLKERHTDADLTRQQMSTDADVDDDVLMLYEFHLIGIGVGNEAFELHPLVQLAARKWLERQNSEDQWLRRSIMNLEYALLRSTDLQSLQWPDLLPHMRLALTCELQDEASSLCLADMCFIASYEVESLFGALESSLWARRSWTERKKHLGNAHIDTLRAELRLAGLLQTLGRKVEVENMLNRCSTIAEKQSDSSREWRDFHIRCLHEIGKRKTSQENLADAETYFRRALELGSKHSEMAYIPSCVASLTDVLLNQNKLSEAETLCRQALDTCTKTYGSGYQITSDIVECLADVLYSKGNLEGALEMYSDASEGFKHIFGVGNHLTLISKTKIARILQAQGKMQEAVNLLEQIYQITSNSCRQESRFTLIIAQNYAQALQGIGKAMQALDVMKACAMSTQRMLGPDHEHTIQRLNFVSKWECEFEEEQVSQVVRSVHEQQVEREQQGRKRKRDECGAE